MFITISGYHDQNKTKELIEQFMKENNLEVSFDEALIVDTPLGKLVAEPYHDSYYPGIHIHSKNGKSENAVLSVEVHSEDLVSKAYVYDRDEEEPVDIIELNI